MHQHLLVAQQRQRMLEQQCQEYQRLMGVSSPVACAPCSQPDSQPLPAGIAASFTANPFYARTFCNTSQLEEPIATEPHTGGALGGTVVSLRGAASPLPQPPGAPGGVLPSPPPPLGGGAAGTIVVPLRGAASPPARAPGGRVLSPPPGSVLVSPPPGAKLLVAPPLPIYGLQRATSSPERAAATPGMSGATSSPQAAASPPVAAVRTASPSRVVYASPAPQAAYLNVPVCPSWVAGPLADGGATPGRALSPHPPSVDCAHSSMPAHLVQRLASAPCAPTGSCRRTASVGVAPGRPVQGIMQPGSSPTRPPSWIMAVGTSTPRLPLRSASATPTARTQHMLQGAPAQPARALRATPTEAAAPAACGAPPLHGANVVWPGGGHK